MSKLEPLAISEILNERFFIRHYQRGYRWTSQQVEQLLDDIDTFSPEKIKDSSTFYCLQPIVVKKIAPKQLTEYGFEGDWYEVIDGQQRLTTLYLILQYVNEFWRGRQKIDKFKVNYETRKDSVSFLENIKVNNDDITVDIDNSNIDFYHISKAYQAIRNWEVSYDEKRNRKFSSDEFLLKLLNNSKIIWYEVEQEEDSIQLFERLNLGKIPLTNSELTKALFLSQNSFNELASEDKKIKHYEIASLWDEIEDNLNKQDLKFWSFITNKNRNQFDTKIDLLLDFISGKPNKDIDPLYTFLYFLKNNTHKNGVQLNLSEKWSEIEQFYNVLIEWSLDRDFYHLIGYLISSKDVEGYTKPNLKDLVKLYMSNKKDTFINHIKSLISNSVKCNLHDINYHENPGKLYNLLLLFNVETYRCSNTIDNYYPFKNHKSNSWSLEHIHAQNSEGLSQTKKDQWVQWIGLHLPVLNDLYIKVDTENEVQYIKELIESSKKYYENSELLDWERFKNLSSKISKLLSPDNKENFFNVHGLGNMALLSQPDNASLNNTAFEVKRREIIRLDKEGSFIPIATKRVFLGYYSDNNNLEHKFIWSIQDSKSYLEEIERTLGTYLPDLDIQ